MDLIYTSTRDKNVSLTASKAIIQGLSKEGGLFVPTQFPSLDKTIDELSAMSYREVAYEVMKLFLTDYTEAELKECIDAAYDDKFDCEDIAPLAEADSAYFLELYHGATIAFKDMALSILPHLLTCAARKNHVNKEIVILTATSGDTGKAALAGFAGVKGTRIVVFYPKNGVSAIQERQMVTQQGDNVKVIGVTGNFDDTQTGVKTIFSDQELVEALDKKGFQFSSANSINIGRLIPQVVYYVFAYSRLCAEKRIKAGSPVNFAVPTGNFGNILACFYAKKIGLPVGKLVCASNENKVLFDFFKTGTYDSRREFVLTSSPSMDILISSNLERLIYLLCGSDAEKNADFMQSLKESGQYEITSQMREQLSDFYGGFATEEQAAATIKRIYDRNGYVIDPHTAVAAYCYREYRKENADKSPAVVISTASPYKFTRTVMESIEGIIEEESDFELIDRLSELSMIPIPNAIEEIRTATVLHNTVCDKKDMKKEVMDWLRI